MKKTDKPSEYFIGAILRGFDRAEAECKGPVTCSQIWDYVVMECWHKGDFVTMFAWDTSKAQHKNRIRDIEECIAHGHVPGLGLVLDDDKIFVERLLT